MAQKERKLTVFKGFCTLVLPSGLTTFACNSKEKEMKRERDEINGKINFQFLFRRITIDSALDRDEKFGANSAMN